MTGWWEARRVALAVVVLDSVAVGVSIAGSAIVGQFGVIGVAVGMFGCAGLFAIVATIASGGMQQMQLPSAGPGQPATDEWRVLDAYARGARRIGDGQYVKNHFASMWSPGLAFGLAALPLFVAGAVLVSRYGG